VVIPAIYDQKRNLNKHLIIFLFFANAKKKESFDYLPKEE
jgi:hypothetical protein